MLIIRRPTAKFALTILLLALTGAQLYCMLDSLSSNLPLDEQLFIAASAGDMKECKALLHRGASPLGRDSNGGTPLMCAAGAGRVDIAQLLIDAGAAIDANDRFGMTPLLYAVRGGNVPTVALLLGYDADYGRESLAAAEESALAYADSCGSDAVAAFLRARQKVVPTAYLPPRDDRRAHSMLIGS